MLHIKLKHNHQLRHSRLRENDEIALLNFLADYINQK